MAALTMTRLSRLFGDENGGALTLTALSLPVLIGFAGFAIDLSQWYMWKRELQYAVDQAAVAAAYAYGDDETRDTYIARATQEFEANVGFTEDFATDPVIALVDYDSGSNNAVEVSAAAGKPLPFSSIFVSTPVQVKVRAWATWEGGSDADYTSCLLALDPTAGKAVWFNGGPTVDAGCGVAALSTASNAIAVSGGSSPIDLGWVIAAGGITDYFDDRDDTEVLRNASGLTDPFAELTPPDNPVARTFTCPDEEGDSSSDGASFTITLSVTRTVSEKYYTGERRNRLSLHSTTTVSEEVVTETQTGSASATIGSTTTASSTSQGSVVQHGQGNSKWYDRTDTIVSETRLVVGVVDNQAGTVPTSGTGGSLQPGTYQGFDINCDVTLAPGIYVIDGGQFSINAGDSITGNGVMFVLKNGAGLKINGGGQVNLTAMNELQLIAAGVSPDDAPELEGMLIFEDRSSTSDGRNKINGNSSTYLNGTVYLPNSAIEILGTAGVSSRCLMIAANTIRIGGSANLSTFCPPGMSHNDVVLSSNRRVQLVL